MMINEVSLPNRSERPCYSEQLSVWLMKLQILEKTVKTLVFLSDLSLLLSTTVFMHLRIYMFPIYKQVD